MDTPHEIDDATAEALLAGRSVAPGLEPLARVVIAYRHAAGRPVPPRGELAAQMATGVFGRPGPYRVNARAGRLGRIATRLGGEVGLWRRDPVPHPRSRPRPPTPGSGAPA